MRFLFFLVFLVSLGRAESYFSLEKLVIEGAVSADSPAALFVLPRTDSLTLPMIRSAFEEFKQAYSSRAVLSCGFLLEALPDTSRRTVSIRVQVTEGEWVESVDLEGLGGAWSDSLRPLLFHQAGGPFSADSLPADVARMKSFFASKHMKADASASFSFKGGREKRIVFHIGILKLDETLRFSGFRHFTLEELKSRWRADSSYSLEDRRARLLKTYHQEGFFNCRIVVQAEAGGMMVKIEEGVRARLVHIDIDGNRKMPADSLFNLADFKPGEFFSEKRVKALVDAMVGLYENRGFPFCEIEVAGLAADSAGVHLHLLIQENGRYVFGGLFVHGLKTTRPLVVERLSGFQPGADYRQNELSRMRERLLRSGLFETVDAPTLTLQKDRRVADIHIPLSEGAQNSAEGIAGLAPETEGPRWSGFFDLSLGNLGGTFRKLDLHYQKERPLTASEVRYREPWLLNGPVSGEASFNFRLDELSYTLWEWGLKFDLPVGDHVSVYSGVSRRSISFPPSVAGDTLPGTERSVATQAGVTIDYQDFPENPHRGFWVDVPLQYSYKSGGADNFNEARTGVHVKSFFPLGRAQVIYAGVYYRTLFTRDTVFNQGELYPLGGTANLRGYRENQFYAPTVLSGSVEYRWITGLRSRIALFADAGLFDHSSVFQNVQVRRDILYGYGVGLRLRARAGQFGIDYGIGRDDKVFAGKIHVRVKNQF